MPTNILKLDELVKNNTRFFYFPEYQHQAEEILSELINAKTTRSLNGSRKKRLLNLSDSSKLIIYIERDEDDLYRSEREKNVNYSQKEILIARSLSELAEFSDKVGDVKFSKPLGYIEEGKQRKSIFLYEKGLESNKFGVGIHPRTFAYFVMLYNGILHREGAKDFMLTKRGIYVVDFEHAEFVQEKSINWNIYRILSFNQVNPGINKFTKEDLYTFERMYTLERKKEILIGNLNKNAPELSKRLIPYLTKRGFFNGEVVLGPAYDTIMKVKEIISKPQYI